MAEIKILQMSDLHLDSLHTKDPQIILNALWKDLDNFKGIDFILFTGDLVKGGDSKDNFKKAFQILVEPLLNKTNVSKDNFFIVPGNHDVQLSAVDDIIEKGLEKILVNRDALNFFIDSQIENGFRHIERFEHFNDFKTNVIGTEHAVTFNKLFSTHVVEKNSTRIGIACLNSAWRTTGKGGDHDNGRMLIGERQVYECLEDIGDCDIKIAIHHHPLDWLTEDDKNDIESVLFREFDFIFCGHLHRANLEMVKSLEDKIVVIQGGSLYIGRSHYNGYSVLYFDTQESKGTLHLRTYFDGRNKFDKAVDRCPDGEIPIVIKKEKFNRTVENDIRENKAQTKENTLIRYILWQTRGRDSKIRDELVRIIEEVIPYPDGRTIGSSEKEDKGEFYSINYLREKVIRELDFKKPKSVPPDQEQKKMDKYQRNYLFLHISLSISKESSVPSKDAAWYALKILKDAQEKFPDYPEIEYLLARLFYIGDFYDEALKAISRFYKVNKDDTSPLVAQIEEIQNAIDRKSMESRNKTLCFMLE